MNTFGETLSSLIKTHRLSITDIAAECGIERSFISKVIKGTRSISIPYIEMLLPALKLNPIEKTELINAYIEDNIGILKYNEYIKLLKKISIYHDAAPEGETLEYKPTIELNDDGNITSIESLSDIASLAKHIVYCEIIKEDGFVYSNFPTDIMIDIMRPFPNKKLDFKHIVVKKTNINYENVEFISDVLDMMSLGYYSSYYTDGGVADNTVLDNFLYPYYFITSSKLLLVDTGSQSGFISTNIRAIEAYKRNFLKKFENTTSFVNIYDDILILKEDILKIDEYYFAFDKCIEFGSFGCITTLMLTKDMWNQITKPDLPGREFLIDTTYDYYQGVFMRRGKIKYIVTKSSLKNFVDYGVIVSLPKEYVFPLNKQNRVKVLKLFCEYIIEKDIVLYFVSDDILSTNSDFSIELRYNSNYSLAQFYFIKENLPLRFNGNVSLTIEDGKVVEEFKNFLECLSISDYAYSRKKSIEIIKEEILRCEMLPDD